jgi:hypothetical protein
MRYLGLRQRQLDQRVARHGLFGLVLPDPRRNLAGADLAGTRRAPQRVVRLQDQRSRCVQTIEFIEVATRSRIRHGQPGIAYST